jgi:hypothetical protein
MISWLLFSHEKQTRYLRKESSRHDLDRHRSLFVGGDVVRSLAHERQAKPERFMIRRGTHAGSWFGIESAKARRCSTASQPSD